MDSIKVLNLTTHLGGGLGVAIGSFIAQSELHHSVLELEKSINPCTSQFSLKIDTLTRKNDLARLVRDYDVLLIHYYCHPLIAWALLEINCSVENKVVAWCHNNGLDRLHPLPDNLNVMTDSVILSGCKDNRYSGSEVIRPAPLAASLDEAANRLFDAKNIDKPSFRYVGSLSEAKIHECAFEWFRYLAERWEFDIATLDLNHGFAKFKVLTGETRRSILYDHFFCVVYPLTDNHYGCGELGLQEMLMLGYPVILRRNNVELDIVKGLSGVYFADSKSELDFVCSEVVANWNLLVEDWRTRSIHNTDIISRRQPYSRLDFLLAKVHRQRSLRQKMAHRPGSLDIVKFAYNQKNVNDLKDIITLWNQSGRGKLPTKGSPAQFVKYFPDLLRSNLFQSVL